MMFEALAELILINERNDYRFEQFCLAILSRHEGITYLPTSQSWDLGRDARAMGRGRGSHMNVLCATLNENLDAKVDADLLKLTARASPDRIVYCSSQKLSEHRLDEIAKVIRRHTAKGSVEVISAIQLARLSEANQEIFDKYYHSELQEIRSTILSEKPTGAPSVGLRLALLTFGSEEGANLRQEALHATLLDRLSEEQAASAQEICASFSTDLGLPKALPESFILHVLNSAKEEGDVERTVDGWKLTEAGKKKQEALPLEGAQHLLEGRRIIRQRLESLTGKKISDQQYAGIWAGVVDSLGGIFHANGLEIVKGVEQLLGGEMPTDQPLDLKRLLEKGMKRAVTVIATEELRDSTYQALMDLFTERDGDGFNWLIRVAERFVTLCALGLEGLSGDAIRETLTSQEVALDSDIILDFLCDAEPDHATSRDLLTAWLRIGGKILVSPIVLEEVAHNAWISETDFKATEALLGKLRTGELKRYIRSPFVRTFHYFKAPAAQWPYYIGQYKGNSQGDYTKVLSILKQRLKVQVLPAAFDETLKERIIFYLRQTPNPIEPDAEQLEDVTHKVDRDGRLLASLAATRSNEDASISKGPTLLLSSSVALRSAELKFKDEFGEARLVLNKRAFSYLLASVPQTSLGADTLRRALFDFGSYSRLRSHDRKALRIIRATGLYDWPWAERATLRQHLSRAIKSEAEKRGVTRTEIQREITSGSAPESTAALVISAVQSMAVPSAIEVELTSTKRRVAELEKELAERPPRPRF